MPFRAIAYVSEASRSLTEERLQRLVAEAVQFNESVDVTGALLFDGSRFLQYLEGPEAGTMRRTRAFSRPAATVGSSN